MHPADKYGTYSASETEFICEWKGKEVSALGSPQSGGHMSSQQSGAVCDRGSALGALGASWGLGTNNGPGRVRGRLTVLGPHLGTWDERPSGF